MNMFCTFSPFRLLLMGNLGCSWKKKKKKTFKNLNGNDQMKYQPYTSLPLVPKRLMENNTNTFLNPIWIEAF